MARPASDNTTAVWKFLRGKGLTSAQAAGVIGAMQQESGQGLNPAAVNPSSGATGIAQWLGGRKNAAVESKRLGPQLNHLWAELQGPERGALQALKGAHTIEDATRAWLMKFERPGPGEQVLGRRVANARNVFRRLGGVGGNTGAAGGGGDTGTPGRTPTTTTTTPGVDNSAQRAMVALNFLSNKNSDVLDFASQIKQLQDIPGTTETQTTRIPGSSGGGGSPTSASGQASDLASFAAKRADALDAKRFPYRWGGGHGAKISDINKAVPVDCSGAVSAVLGIDPRVSGQFGKWGRPGDGGRKGVTIYSNGHHVLMKINGRFFGTSGTNPGGGAGWIPQSAISPGYLKGFTVRHSNR